MTENQIRDLIIVVIILALIFIPIFLIFRSLLKKYREQASNRIQGYIKENEIDQKQLRYFTTGHPYNWCQITEQELRVAINRNSWFIFSPIPVPMPVKFLINYNSKYHALHVVFTNKKTFNWQSLKYHEKIT